MRRTKLPPPEALTAADVVRIILAVMMVPLGIVLLVRAWQIAFSLQALVVGLAFTGFGVYRLYLAWQRLRLLRQRGG
jgi:uncharacterized membrane protein YqaE (UPF0057 family)